MTRKAKDRQSVGVADKPVVFWASDPVRPGDTVMALGGGFRDTMAVQVCRLPERRTGKPAFAAALSVAGPWRSAKVLQQSDGSIQFVLPTSLPPGCFAFCVGAPGRWSEPALLNRTRLTWLLGDDGATARPGGLLRVFGRLLQPDGKKAPTLCLKHGAKTWSLACVRAERHAAVFRLPHNIPSGVYQALAHNGTGGNAGWSAPVKVEIACPPAWPTRVFDVREYGAKGDGSDSTKAIQAALAAAGKNGGGLIRFPAGRYRITGTLTVPRRTVLQGERLERTILFGGDENDQIPDLECVVRGSDNFGIEELQFHFIFARCGIVADIGTPGAGNVFLRRVWFFHTRFMGAEGRPLSITGHRFDRELIRKQRWITVQVGGANVRVEDCRILGAAQPLRAMGLRHSRFADNLIGNGRFGGCELDGSHNVVIEDNEFYGQDWTSTGGCLSAYTSQPEAGPVYVARNRYLNMFGWDREALTSDACACGAWHGPVEAGPDFIRAPGAGWQPEALRDWFAYVSAGTGTGQWRRIVANTTDMAHLAEPWSVPLDATSRVGVNRAKHDFVICDNRFADVGAAFQSFGLGHDFLIEGNVAERSRGFKVASLIYCGGLAVNNIDEHGIMKVPDNVPRQELINRFEPNHCIQFIGNHTRSGGGLRSVNYGRCVSNRRLPIDILMGAPQSLGLVFRGNTIEYDGAISVGSLEGNEEVPFKLTQDVLIEGNCFRDGEQGIVVDRTVKRVVIRNNRYERITAPTVIAGAEVLTIGGRQKG
ncbi:MAG: hypothetical protein HY343_12050 [Lentisphaerae bacterium]|nr:hypothetical protein [Lentisphaerota bacterium]